MAISVVIGTCNSARHISRVLESVKNFDEVVVCDLESTDETLDIVKSRGVKIIHVGPRQDKAAIAIRDYALNNTKNDWILTLRPQEIVTPQLRDFLTEFIENPGVFKGIFIPRKNYILNRLRDHSYPDYQLRFFNRKFTTWSDDRNADPNINGKIKKIPATKGEYALIKLPRSLDEILRNLNLKANKDKAGMEPTLQRVTTWNLFWKPFAVLMKEYFFKGKFQYGIEGYMTSLNKSLQVYCTIAKIHEDRVMEEFNKALDRVIAGEEMPEIPRIPSIPEVHKDDDHE